MSSWLRASWVLGRVRAELSPSSASHLRSLCSVVSSVRWRIVTVVSCGCHRGVSKARDMNYWIFTERQRLYDAVAHRVFFRDDATLCHHVFLALHNKYGDISVVFYVGKTFKNLLNLLGILSSILISAASWSFTHKLFNKRPSTGRHVLDVSGQRSFPGVLFSELSLPLGCYLIISRVEQWECQVWFWLSPLRRLGRTSWDRCHLA